MCGGARNATSYHWQGMSRELTPVSALASPQPDKTVCQLTVLCKYELMQKISAQEHCSWLVLSLALAHTWALCPTPSHLWEMLVLQQLKAYSNRV